MADKAVILVYKIFLPRIYNKVTVDSFPSVCIFIQQETSIPKKLIVLIVWKSEQVITLYPRYTNAAVVVTVFHSPGLLTHKT